MSDFTREYRGYQIDLAEDDDLGINYLIYDPVAGDYIENQPVLISVRQAKVFIDKEISRNVLTDRSSK